MNVYLYLSICLSSWRNMSSSSWRCISLAGDIYLLLEIYISCWRYLKQDDSYSQIYTSRLWFLSSTNSQKIVKKRQMKMTYELDEYLRLDIFSHWKVRTKIMSIISTMISKQFSRKNDTDKVQFLDTMSISISSRRQTLYFRIQCLSPARYPVKFIVVFLSRSLAFTA